MAAARHGKDYLLNSMAFSDDYFAYVFYYIMKDLAGLLQAAHIAVPPESTLLLSCANFHFYYSNYTFFLACCQTVHI